MAADNFLWFPEAAKGGNLSDAAVKPQGETSDNWFKPLGGLECLSVGVGVSQAETTGSGTSGSGAGKAKFEEFTIEKYVDLASVPLYMACVAGAHYPTVMLANRKAGGSSLLYLQYAFRMVFVTGITWSGGGGEEGASGGEVAGGNQCGLRAVGDGGDFATGVAGFSGDFSGGAGDAA